MTMEELQVLSQALKKWGNEAQVHQAVEEMGELIVALHHYRRGRVTKQAVQTEIADVLIMATQLAMIFGLEDVDKERAYKIARLADRLKDKPV